MLRTCEKDVDRQCGRIDSGRLECEELEMCVLLQEDAAKDDVSGTTDRR